jgi:hypothetical protein
MHTSSFLKGRAFEDALWQTAFETAGPVEFSPACERSLRAWITIGIQRMERQRRMAPEDLAGREIHVQQNLQAVCKGVSRSSDRPAAYATAARISSDSK